MTTLAGALIERRRLAAHAAADAAQALDGNARSLSAQAALEVALSDFRGYQALYDQLGPLAEELAAYARRGTASLLSDLANPELPAVRARIREHNRATGAGLLETRDLGAGTTWATIPGWVTTDRGPTAIATAPLLTLLGKPMPEKAGLDLRRVGWTTPPVAVVQSALNAAPAESNPVESQASLAVKTAVCIADVATQLLEQGAPGLDAQLLPAMSEACDAAIEGAVLAALIAAGTAVAYVDVSPTAAEAWDAIERAVRSAQTARKIGGKPMVILHPRRISWLRAAADSAVASAGWDRVMAGVEVISDPAVSTTAGAGTEDQVIVLAAPDCLDLLTGPTLVRVSEGGSATNSGTLTSSITVRRNYAVASRLAAGIAVVSGTGLIAPV